MGREVIGLTFGKAHVLVMAQFDQMLEWSSGQWYFAVYCHVCGWQFPFSHTDEPLLECPLELTCIDCGESDYYCPKEFVRVESK